MHFKETPCDDTLCAPLDGILIYDPASDLCTVKQGERIWWTLSDEESPSWYLREVRKNLFPFRTLQALLCKKPTIAFVRCVANVMKDAVGTFFPYLFVVFSAGTMYVCKRVTRKEEVLEFW